MKYTVIIASLALLALSSCEDDESGEPFLLEEGTYTGSFSRSSPNTRWLGANVTLTFENGRFSGSSDQEKYPAICEGTYQVVGSNEITFENSCVWTAEFDWTFILGGEFRISEQDQKLVITREYEGEVIDTYELTLE
ncbi:MAG: hypothetical protein WBA23_00260 [Tunicatimonas sp.]|uniref:hypothetical protein n=1 Tax=Tunicatimonas sp. TaxID=1940096 RepID=UPI003C72B872